MVLPLLILAGGTIASLAMQGYSTFNAPTVITAKSDLSSYSQHLPFIALAVIAFIIFMVIK